MLRPFDLEVSPFISDKFFHSTNGAPADSWTKRDASASVVMVCLTVELVVPLGRL